MPTSALRRGALVAFVAGVALVLSGCAAVGVPAHIQSTAMAAKKFAAQLTVSPGVGNASVAYNPADPAGESVAVRVQLRAGSSAAEWAGVLHTARAALTKVPLDGTRRDFRITERGNSGPEFVPQQFSNWPTAMNIQTSFERWHAVEAATGLDLRFDLADVTAPVQYQVASKAQSARFMTSAASRRMVLKDAELRGYGFDTTSPPTADAQTIYKLLSQKLPPMYETSDVRAPAERRFVVAWGPAGTIAAGTGASIYAPKSAGAHPARADVSLAIQIADALPDSGAAVSWVGERDAAWVTFGACPESTKRTVTADDRAFADQIAAAGYSIPSSGGPGECLP